MPGTSFGSARTVPPVNGIPALTTTPDCRGLEIRLVARIELNDSRLG
jgi:hypothetical protein